MNVVLAIAAIVFLLPVAGISDAHLQAKCLVPPITDEGKCLQKAGAQCAILQRAGWAATRPRARRV